MASLFVSPSGNDANSGLTDLLPFQTVAHALEVASGLLPTPVSISLSAGVHTSSSALKFLHPFGHLLTISGPPPSIASLTSVLSISGTPGAWQAVLAVNDIAGMTVGGFIEVFNTAGASHHELHRGVWKVIAIPDYTHVRVANSSWNFQPPSGAITGSIRSYSAQVNFTGCSGLITAGLGGFANCVLVGDGAQDTVGVWNGYPEAGPQGRTKVGPHLCVSGFGIEAIRANYGGVIIADQCVASGNGNNGFMARDTGQLMLTNCLSSGNGWLNAPLGGHGYLSQNTSSIYAYSCGAVGNKGDGFFSRTNSNVLCDTGGPCAAAGNNNGFRVGFNSFLQADYSTVPFTLTNGVMGEYNSSLLMSGAVVQSAWNGAVATTGSYVRVDGASMSGISSTPYYAETQGTVMMSGATGMTGAFPTANAARSATGDFGRVVN